jgi:hypothetical protein
MMFRPKMEKKMILLLVSLFIISLSSLNIVNATAGGLEYEDYVLNGGNYTYSDFVVKFNCDSFYDSIYCDDNHESVVTYTSSINNWNSLYNKTATYCNTLIKKYDSNHNYLSTVLSRNFTDDSTSSYYVTLGNKQQYEIQNNCYFSNVGLDKKAFEMPLAVNLIFPTSGSTMSSYSLSIDRMITSVLKSYTESNMNKINGLFRLGYELILISFWIGAIILLLGIVGLIFYVLFWIYDYFKKLARKI